MQRSALLTVLLSCCVLVAADTPPAEDTAPRYEFYPKAFPSRKGEVPACTPLAADVETNKVWLSDPNDAWKSISIPRDEYDAATRFKGFDECVAVVPAYKDRYTAEQLVALSKGDLAAGMPVEFALMILGPPTQPPGVVSMINPSTEKPETYHTYMWLHVFGGMGPLRTAFSIVGGLALGVAGTTSSLATSLNALKVANAAASAELVTWQVSSLSQAKFVTIQTTSDQQIHLLVAN